LVFLVGLAAAVPWKRARAREVFQHLRWPLLVAVIAAVALPLLLHGRAPLPVVAGAFLGCWALITSGQEIWRRIRAKADFVTGLTGVPRAVWGMSLAHFGLGIWAIGVTFVSAFNVEKDVRLAPGTSATLGSYEFTFDGVRSEQGPNYSADTGTISVQQNGQNVAVLQPQKRIYNANRMPMTEAAVDHNPMRDLYVALGEPLDNGDWALRLYYKPMMRLVWLGGVFMVLGGLLAATDRRYRLSRVAEQRIAANTAVASA
jgi:cytochrome c-type biogenesis protein CcmF